MVQDVFSVFVAILGGFIAGLGGPGGLPVLAVLYDVYSLPSDLMAGTSSLIFVVATLMATYLYNLTGDVDWYRVLYLVPTTLLGTQIGSYLNGFFSRQVYGIGLSFLMLSAAAGIFYRRNEPSGVFETISGRKEILGFMILGLIVGFAGGAVGVGGPALSIPAMILVGISPLNAIGIGLAQGIFVTSSTAASYFLKGSIDYRLFLILGFPYVVSQVAGWKTAHRINTDNLKAVIGFFSLLLSIHLLFSSTGIYSGVLP